MIRPSRSSYFLSLTLTLASALLATGCGAPEPSPSGVLENTGSVGLALDVGSSVRLTTISYQIDGNGFHKTGSIDVANSQKISSVIGGIPAGAGYTLTLSAVATNDASITCSGSATFDITAGATATARVHLLCRLPAKTGSVLVDGTLNVCPSIDAVTVDHADATVGHSIALSAAASDLDQGPAALGYLWSSSSGVLSGASTASATLSCTSAGEVTITLSVSDGDCSDSTSFPVTCSPAAPGTASVVINEVESNLGVPGDWVELYNASASTIDLSGFIFKDNDDTHIYRIPDGSSIASGAYFLLEESALSFGLGSADSARLYDAGGTAIVDQYSWLAHAATTYGRCPNGRGAFTTTASVTKGFANDCGGGTPGAGGAGGMGGSSGASGASGDGGTGGTAGAPPSSGGASGASGDGGSSGSGAGAGAGGATPTLVYEPWPGPNTVVTADNANVFGGNMSGLFYEPAKAGVAPVLWAVQNSPSKLYSLFWDGTAFVPTLTDDWTAGKALHYPSGTGNPDSEGVTKAELDSTAAYVSTERDNDVSTTSKLSVLRFDTTAAGAALSATHEWNLTSDLPVVGPNLGLEGITWVPDGYLLASGFVDESTGELYDPLRYQNHGGGVFLVGLEGNGVIYAYVFDHVGGAFQRLATVATGQISVMDLSFDRDQNTLFAYCDNTCGNRLTLLAVDVTEGSPTRGRFVIRRGFARPSSLPDVNNEGIAFAPESECANGFRSFFWADDAQTEGHALRRDALPCGSLLSP